MAAAQEQNVDFVITSVPSTLQVVVGVESNFELNLRCAGHMDGIISRWPPKSPLGHLQSGVICMFPVLTGSGGYNRTC